MSKLTTANSPIAPGDYVIASTTAQGVAYDALCGQKGEFPDVDLTTSATILNSQLTRQVVIVKNASGVTLAPGAALTWFPGTFGTQVQAAGLGSVIRCYVPGYVRGSTTVGVPANAYFNAIFWGPVLGLNNGTTLSTGDFLIPSTVAGQVKNGSALFGSVGASAALTNSAALTVFATNQFTIPVNTLVAGDVLRVTGRCPITAPANNALTLQFQVLIGATIVATLPAAITNVNGDAFNFDVLINILTIGAGGTLTGYGQYQDGVEATAPWLSFTALGSTAVDTTATQLVSVKAQWSGASASNSVTLARFELSRNGLIQNQNPTQAQAVANFTGTGTAAQSRMIASCVW